MLHLFLSYHMGQWFRYFSYSAPLVFVLDASLLLFELRPCVMFLFYSKISLPDLPLVMFQCPTLFFVAFSVVRLVSVWSRLRFSRIVLIFDWVSERSSESSSLEILFRRFPWMHHYGRSLSCSFFFLPSVPCLFFIHIHWMDPPALASFVFAGRDKMGGGVM
jgi:hypothetical protein